MDNFHIYRDGKYSLSENLKMKAVAAAKKAIHDYDAWCIRLYEVK